MSQLIGYSGVLDARDSHSFGENILFVVGGLPKLRVNRDAIEFSRDPTFVSMAGLRDMVVFIYLWQTSRVGTETNERMRTMSSSLRREKGSPAENLDALAGRSSEPSSPLRARFMCNSCGVEYQELPARRISNRLSPPR